MGKIYDYQSFAGKLDEIMQDLYTGESELITINVNEEKSENFDKLQRALKKFNEEHAHKITFESNKAFIKDESSNAIAFLVRILDWAVGQSDFKIHLEFKGYTDDDTFHNSSMDYKGKKDNEALGLMRADAVLCHILEKVKQPEKVKRMIVKTGGVSGAENPETLKKKDGKVSKALSRRVEVIINTEEVPAPIFFKYIYHDILLDTSGSMGDPARGALGTTRVETFLKDDSLKLGDIKMLQAIKAMGATANIKSSKMDRAKKAVASYVKKVRARAEASESRENHIISIMTFDDGGLGSALNRTVTSDKQMGDISAVIGRAKPTGSTPFYETLQKLYRNRVGSIISKMRERGEIGQFHRDGLYYKFTVVITDGQPSDEKNLAKDAFSGVNVSRMNIEGLDGEKSTSIAVVIPPYYQYDLPSDPTFRASSRLSDEENKALKAFTERSGKRFLEYFQKVTSGATKGVMSTLKKAGFKTVGGIKSVDTLEQEMTDIFEKTVIARVKQIEMKNKEAEERISNPVDLDCSTFKKD